MGGAIAPPTFNSSYPTEFKPSGIPGGGLGWYAKIKIPKNTRLRRVSLAQGTLFRFDSLAQLMATSWDMEETVHYGIAHHFVKDAIFFSNPGCACNHADPTREPSVHFRHIFPSEKEDLVTSIAERTENCNTGADLKGESPETYICSIAYEVWTLKDVEAGEEMFIDYKKDFPKCEWYDHYHESNGRTPLSSLGEKINNIVSKVAASHAGS